MDDLPLFLEQVDDVDYINLFLTTIGQGSLSPEIISQVCDGIRVELEKKDMKKYVNSILTAHVVKRPSDYESALALLLRLRGEEFLQAFFRPCLSSCHIRRDRTGAC